MTHKIESLDPRLANDTVHLPHDFVDIFAKRKHSASDVDEKGDMPSQDQRVTAWDLDHRATERDSLYDRLEIHLANRGASSDRG
jgi:hypothetical protein